LDDFSHGISLAFPMRLWRTQPQGNDKAKERS
jgi:hypothetical protein